MSPGAAPVIGEDNLENVWRAISQSLSRSPCFACWPRSATRRRDLLVFAVRCLIVSHDGIYVIVYSSAVICDYLGEYVYNAVTTAPLLALTTLRWFNYHVITSPAARVITPSAVASARDAFGDRKKRIKW